MHVPRLVVAATFVLAVTLGSGVTNSSPVLAKQPCTTTSFGTCIQGGDRCTTAMYAHRGRDAAGKRWVCKGSRSHPSWERSRCAKLLDRAFVLARAANNDEINPLLDFMGDSCPAHYEVFTDYVSTKIVAEKFGRDSCADLLQYRISRYAIAYLRRDGYCTSSAGWASRAREGGASDPTPVARWVCSYSPTMDRNWHNDVLCTNGSQHDRPYLREGDSFITRDEIMRSAREYERQLNGG